MDREDHELVAVGGVVVGEIHPAGQAPADARAAPVAPEVEDDPLALEVRRPDVFRDASGVGDVPGWRLLAEVPRDRRELQVDRPEVDGLTRVQRDVRVAPTWR